MKRALVAACLALGLAPGVASAQATLIAGLGGPAGFGTNVLPNDDEAGSVMVDLTPGFPSGISFYGTTYTALYVNVNGLVSFGSAQAVYRDFAFRGLTSPAIGVFYADVDTRPGPQPGDPTGANDVYWHLSAGRLVVTWYLVTRAPSQTDLRNSFQIVISQRAGMPDGQVQVTLRYNQCEWAGAVSPRSTTPGIAGVDRGDGATFFRFHGSGEFTVASDLCEGSNVGTSGVYRFDLDVWPAAMCGNRMVETGEECDDANSEPFDGCDMCRRVIAVLDAGMVPDSMNRDGGPRADGGDGGGGSGMDGGGGGGDGGGGSGDGDGGGGGSGMDGGGGGSGGPGAPVGRDVFGGGCAAGAPSSAAAGLALLALALLARRRRAV